MRMGFLPSPLPPLRLVMFVQWLVCLFSLVCCWLIGSLIGRFVGFLVVERLFGLFVRWLVVWWRFFTSWRKMWIEVLHIMFSGTWPVNLVLGNFPCKVLSNHWRISLPTLWIISLCAGGHKLVTIRVKTHPQRQINTKLFLLKNWVFTL